MRRTSLLWLSLSGCWGIGDVPWPPTACDEECVPCETSDECDDGEVCNGDEWCDRGACAPGTAPPEFSVCAQPDCPDCAECVAGTCVDIECGNGVRTHNEECDDGETLDSGPCLSDCTLRCEDRAVPDCPVVADAVFRVSASVTSKFLPATHGGAADLEISGTYLDGVQSVEVLAGATVIPCAIDEGATATLVKCSFYRACNMPLGDVAVRVVTERGSVTSGPVVALTPISVSATEGSNITNPGSTELPFRTMSHAFSVAYEGCTIQLAPGTYDEALGEDWLGGKTLHAGMVLRRWEGVGPGAVVIDGTSGGFSLFAGARLQGVTLQNFTTFAAVVYGPGAVVSAVSFTQNEVGLGVGTGGSVHVENSDFTANVVGASVGDGAVLEIVGGNVAQNSVAGVRSTSTGVLVMDGVFVLGNPIGVQATGGGAVQLDGCEVHDNATPYDPAKAGVVRSGTGALTISGGDFTSNDSGAVLISGTGEVLIEGATFEHNQPAAIILDGAFDVRLRDNALSCNGLRDTITACGPASGACEGAAVRILDGAGGATLDMGTVADGGANSVTDNGCYNLIDSSGSSGVVSATAVGTVFSPAPPQPTSGGGPNLECNTSFAGASRTHVGPTACADYWSLRTGITLAFE